MRRTIPVTKLCRSFVLAMAFLCLTFPGFAQNAKLQLDNLEKLNSKAEEVNSVTLDGRLLELTWKFIEADHDPEAAELKEIIKGLNGIYVKNFVFDEPDQYSQADVEAIRAQLAAPGWSRIVESHSRRSREHDEIYVMKQGDAIVGMAILVAEARELTVVNIVGTIDMEKLSHLEGHFGIPDDDGCNAFPGGCRTHKHKGKYNDSPGKDKDQHKDKSAAQKEDSDE
jgi:hypothetical protein